MKSRNKEQTEAGLIVAMDHLRVIAQDESPDELAVKLKEIYRADSVFVGEQHVVINRGCVSTHLKKKLVKAKA